MDIKKDPIYMLPARDSLKVKGWKKILCKQKCKKAGLAKFTVDNIGFETKTVTKDQKRHYSKSPTYEPLIKFPTFKDVNVHSHIQSPKLVHRSGLYCHVLYPLQVALLLCTLQCAY